MTPITDLDKLQKIYGEPARNSLIKVADQITPLYHRWISAARFVILSTSGPEGTDASPRGDIDPVVRIAYPKTLLLPDWRGNNRIDSLRNIVRDPRASLMFMIPGQNNVVRVNCRAIVTADADVLAGFEQNGKNPRSVIALTVEEVYFQCAKALMRSALWSAPETEGLPTAGEFIQEMRADFDARPYDEGYEEYAKPRMW
jgi:hypothetical protein